jgi:hypothetical protein
MQTCRGMQSRSASLELEDLEERLRVAARGFAGVLTLPLVLLKRPGAKRRTTAIVLAPWPGRYRERSSPNSALSSQCMRSTPQCLEGEQIVGRAGGDPNAADPFRPWGASPTRSARGRKIAATDPGRGACSHRHALIKARRSKA